MSSDDEEEKDTANDDVVDTDEAEAGDAPPAREETAEFRSGEARRKLRDQLQAEIDAYLKRGGQIEVLEAASSAQGASITAGVNDLSQ
jgi:hypothetical protein